MRDKIISLLIWFIEKDLNGVPKLALTEVQTEGLLASLWDNPAFRNYLKDRNEKLVHAIAGIAGSELEPRDKTRLLQGQRVENLVLGTKAKACHTRMTKDIEEKKKVDKSA